MVFVRSWGGSRLTAALAVLAASSLACTDAQAPAQAPEKARPGSLGAGTPGAQAAVDASGRLRAPTPDEARALSLAFSAELAASPSRPLQAERLANGALALRLDESFQSTVLATTSGERLETMRVPGCEGALVLRILTGIPTSRTGAMASSCSTLAPM